MPTVRRLGSAAVWLALASVTACAARRGGQPMAASRPADAAPLDLSGEWEVDFGRSVGVPPEARTARVVDILRQTRDSLLVESVTTYADGRTERPPGRAYALDGSPTLWRYPERRGEMVDVARWEGAALVVRHTQRDAAGRESVFVDRITVSEDGRTMTSERVYAPGTPGERRLILVANRVR
jgi:hypothetical protein